jgi:hypothetical protein
MDHTAQKEGPKSEVHELEESLTYLGNGCGCRSEAIRTPIKRKRESWHSRRVRGGEVVQAAHIFGSAAVNKPDPRTLETGF